MILIVDDDYEQVKILAEGFKKLGLATCHAKNGREALIKSSIYKPAYIVTEYNLQDMCGISLIRRIQADADIKSSKIIINSSYGTYNERIECLKLGAVDYIQKSKNPEELIIKISSLISTNGAISFGAYEYRRYSHIRDNNKKSIILACERYVKENIEKKISINEIARHIGVNRNKLTEVLKSEENVTIYGFVMRIRIDEAKKLLAQKEIPIQLIAEITGFEFPANFSTAFKKYVGMTPKEYRRNAIDALKASDDQDGAATLCPIDLEAR